MPEQMMPENTLPRPRLHWLDIFKGIALIAMATYHLMWDLSDFGYLEPNYASSGWPKVYARSIASSFVFLAGFSLVLAHGQHIRWRNFWTRWLIIVGAAALVTIASYFLFPEGLIYFGILHSIAAASLVGLLFLRVPWPLIFLAALAAFIAPFFLRSDSFNEPWLWWIGLSTAPPQSFDYVPMLPWLTPFLIGMGVARIPSVMAWLRQNASGENPRKWHTRTLSFFGRHSLVFYLVHQPVLISIIYGLSLVYPAPGHPDAFSRSCVATCLPDASEGFCKRYCDCALTALESQKLLAALQSGTIPDAYRGNIDTIRSQCTIEAQPVFDENGN